MADRQVNRRGLLASGGVGGAALLLAACAGDEKPSGGQAGQQSGEAAVRAPAIVATASAKEPRQGGTFRTRRTLQEANVSPFHQGSDTTFMRTIYDTLWTTRGGGKLQLLLAEKVETPDPTTHVITLKTAKFQDKPPVNGREVSAEDVKALVDYFKDSRDATQAGFMKEEVASVEVVNAKVLRVRTKTPAAYMYADEVTFAKPIAAREVLELDIKTHDPVGSGGFQFKSRTAGSIIEVERFPNFRDAPRPYFATWRGIVIPDDAAAESALLAGNIDLWSPPNSQTAERVRRQLGDKIRIDEYTQLGAYVLGLNANRPPFNDLRARKAVYRAIDRQALINTLEFGKAVVTGWVGAGFEQEALPTAEIQPYVKYDPAEAKQLLQQAGVPLDRTYEILVRADSNEENALAQAVAGQIKDSGIKTTIVVLPRAEWNTRLRDKNGNFDMYLGVAAEDFEAIFRLQHSQSRRLFNVASLNDTEIDRLIERSEQELDTEKRVQLYKEIQKQLLEKYAATVPLYATRAYTASSTALQNWNPSPNAPDKQYWQAWLDR